MNARPARTHTHYDALKVAHDAPLEVIRAAYRSLSQKYHPDRHVDGASSGTLMATLNLAYEVLSHPVKKQEYDAWIQRQELPLTGRNMPEPESRQQIVRAKRRMRLGWLSRKRLSIALSVLASSAALLVYAATQEHDSWLERAWRSELRSDSGPARPGHAAEFTATSNEAQQAELYSSGMKWENSLKGNAISESSGDLRFR